MQVNLPKGINHNTKMDNHEFSNLAHPDNGAIKYAGAGNFANHPGVDDHKMHILNGYRDPSNFTRSHRCSQTTWSNRFKNGWTAAFSHSRAGSGEIS